MSTPDKFVVDLSKWVAKAKGNMDQVVRKVVLDLGTRLVLRSPVGDATYWLHPAPKGYVGGQFRANWQYGETVMPRGTLNTVDTRGSKTIAAIGARLKPGAAGKVHWLVNNLPYAQRIENGWSKRQAPSGVVGVTVVEYQSIVRRAVRGLKP